MRFTLILRRSLKRRNTKPRMFEIQHQIVALAENEKEKTGEVIVVDVVGMSSLAIKYAV